MSYCRKQFRVNSHPTKDLCPAVIYSSKYKERLRLASSWKLRGHSGMDKNVLKQKWKIHHAKVVVFQQKAFKVNNGRLYFIHRATINITLLCLFIHSCTVTRELAGNWIEFFLNNSNLTFLELLYKIGIEGFQNQQKQESPPAWMQEAHCLPHSHSKCLLFQGGTQRWGTPPEMG